MSRQIVADIYKTVDIIDEETGEPTGETEQVVDGAATAAASAALGIGTFKLTDIRDQHPYIVRRLAGGYCWMIENLDLELANFAGKDSTNGGLTRANTDINTANKEYWDPAKSMFEVADAVTKREGYEGPAATMENYFSIASIERLGVEQTSQFMPYEVTTGSIWGSYYYDDETTGAKTKGDTLLNNQYAEMPRSMENGLRYNSGVAADGTPISSAGSDNTWDANHANMYTGHYYNWYAATAESGSFFFTGNATDSICPFGWRLPNGDVGNSSSPSGNWLFNTIYGIGGRPAKYDIPLSFVNSGEYGAYSMTRGDFWSTTSNSNSTARRLDYAYDTLYPRHDYTKVGGLTIRCVSRGNEHNTQPEEPIVGQCAANSICYDSNGGSGSMNPTTNATFGSSKVLSAPTYTRTGYAFVGWSESKDAVQSGAYIYGPNETITVPNLSSEGMTLYAQWLAPENSSYTMQAFGRNETVKTCANMTDGNNGTTEERIALRDERDDNVYIVTKLKDGNCWMTSNLALNLADFAGKTTGTLLTPENTDLTASREDLSTLTIEGVGNGQQTIKYWDPQASSVKKFVDLGLGTAEQYSFPTLANKVLGQANQLHQFQSSGESRYIWGSKCTPVYDEVDTTKIVDTTCVSTTNTYQMAENMFSEMPRSYDTGGANGIGDYYNWYAATAESGTYSMAATSNVEDSVCPSGWGLPTYPTGKTWHGLILEQYGASNDSIQSIVALPVSIVLGGNYTYSDGIVKLVSEEATYTASYGSNGVSSSGMLVREGTVRGMQGSYKPYGVSVRCVKK